MREVTVNKGELLEILETNKEKHISTYKEAVEGYKEELKKVLSQKMASLEAGRMVKPQLNLLMPESFESSYDISIGMLKMHTEDSINLSEHEYRQYVLNEWDWSHRFTSTTSQYV